MNQGVVYVIWARETNAFKVGFCNSEDNVKKRLATLQIGNNQRLVIVAIIKNQTILSERRLHERMAEWNIGGEWFCGNPILAELLGEGYQPTKYEAALKQIEEQEAAVFGRWRVRLKKQRFYGLKLLKVGDEVEMPSNRAYDLWFAGEAERIEEAP